MTSCDVCDHPARRAKSPEPAGGDADVPDVVEAVHGVLRLQEDEQVLRVRSAEGHGVQVEVRNEREAVHVAVAARVAGRQIQSIEDRDLRPAAAAPERRVGLRRGGLVQAREKAAELEGNETARQSLGLVGVGLGAGALVVADDLDAGAQAPRHDRGGRGRVDAGIGPGVAIQVGERDRDAQDGSRVVPVLLAGSERVVGRGPELAPPFHDASRDESGVKRRARPDLLVDGVEILVQPELVLADEVGGPAGSRVGVARVADDRSDDPARQEIELGVVQVADPVVGVLAGNHRREQGVGEVRQRAEGLGPAVDEAKIVESRAAHLQAQRSRGARPEVGGVEAEVIDEAPGCADSPPSRT